MAQERTASCGHSRHELLKTPLANIRKERIYDGWGGGELDGNQGASRGFAEKLHQVQRLIENLAIVPCDWQTSSSALGT